MAKKRDTPDYTKTIKIIDPVIQSLLIVNLFWLYDKKGNLENSLIQVILAYQIFSFGVNYFMKFSKKRKVERLISVVSMALWFSLNFYVKSGLETGKIVEKYYEVVYSSGISKTPIYSSIFLYVGIAIAGWYFSICIREIQYLSKKRRRR